MKRVCLLLTFIITSIVANAQNAFDYHTFSVGAGYGITTTYSDNQSLYNTTAFNLSVNYNISPFTTLSLEGQLGKLSGGNILSTGLGSQFSNSYNAIILHADLQAGELINYSHNEILNSIKNFYIGTGLGLQANNVVVTTISNSISMYTRSTSNLVVPLRFGYEFKMFNAYNCPQLRLDICFTNNTAYGKGLDGDFNPFSHASIKHYNYLTLGLKFGFGAVNSYRKPIDYSPL